MDLTPIAFFFFLSFFGKNFGNTFAIMMMYTGSVWLQWSESVSSLKPEVG